MAHLLHQVLDRDEEVRAVVHRLSRRISENPLKHGLAFDLNPLWLAAYQLAEGGLHENVLYPIIFDQERFLPDFALHLIGSGASGALDLGRRFDVVDVYSHRLFGRKGKWQPFLLRIYAKPVVEADKIWSDYRGQLLSAARDTEILTIIETQEPAALVDKPGDRLVAEDGVRGTVGGFLRNNDGKVYGATCGHVIARGMAASGTPPNSQCVYSVAPQPLPVGVHCTTGCGYMTDVDLALLDLGGRPWINTATSIAALLVPGDIVEMTGASSGTRHYQVGGAMVEQTVADTCWRKLVVLHAPIAGTIRPVAFSVAFTPPPRPGDSGAWLIRTESQWAGMVVASNGLLGFALAATDVLDGANAVFGTALVLA